MNTPTVPIERHVRSRDPETSWNAAAIDPESWSDLQKHIVTILTEKGPLTDDQLYHEYLVRDYPWRSQQRVRTARKELSLSLVVKASNVVGLSRLGNGSQKWELS